MLERSEASQGGMETALRASRMTLQLGSKKQ